MPSVEFDVICFGACLLVLLAAVRLKRSHDQKIRRGASSGFYDLDMARYGSAGGSLMEKAVEENRRPLAPSFTAAPRVAGGTAKAAGRGAPMPVPSSFGGTDRVPLGPPPAFDQQKAGREHPVPPGPGPASDPPGAPLPLLVQPPPPPGPHR
jgi:hypothetical protein